MKLEKRDMIVRPRRLRRTDALRRLVRETCLHKDDFIAPVFISAGGNKKYSIPSMPGVYQWSIDRVQEKFDEYLSDSDNPKWAKIASEGRKIAMNNYNNDKAVCSLVDLMETLI